jgi:hypothetical protein
MHVLSISTTSVVKRQEGEWRGELRARDIDESPRHAAGTPDDTERARPDMHNDGHAKYGTSPLPAAIPGGFARSPVSSRVATVRFAHPFGVVAAAFDDPSEP